MPRPPQSTPAAVARVRRLEARVPDLSVPALLRVRETVAGLLEREALRPRDAEAVLRSTGAD